MLPLHWAPVGEAVVIGVQDESLIHTLQFGIGLHHAGLCDSDRRCCEALFVAGKIQVLNALIIKTHSNGLAVTSIALHVQFVVATCLPVSMVIRHPKRTRAGAHVRADSITNLGLQLSLSLRSGRMKTMAARGCRIRSSGGMQDYRSDASGTERHMIR